METEKWRVVCYVNQFFGQVGGEDMAHMGLSVEDKPIGPAVLFQNLTKNGCEIVGTIICGDNYFAGNIERAVAEGVELVRSMKPDLFTAGPAYNAGRYGISCGNMAAAVGRELGIPAVTGIYPENPAADLFRKDTYIIKTEILSSTLRKAAPVMCSIGLCLLKGEHIAGAQEEGYIIRGIILNEEQPLNTAERSIEMLMKKMRGKAFRSEPLSPAFDVADPAPPVQDLKTAHLALVTDGGLIPESNPDKLKSNGSVIVGCYNWDSLMSDKYFVIHSGYDGTWIMENPHHLLPVDVLREIIEEKRLGYLNPQIYVTCGNCVSVAAAKVKGEQIAKGLLDEGIAAAILTSIWGTSARCGATIVEEIERVGIPITQICAVVGIAKSVGSSRIFRGFAITRPVGNPPSSQTDEKVSRRRYVEKALSMLTKSGSRGAMEDVL